MKKIYFLLLTLSLFSFANAQIVDIPDTKFKAILLNTNSTNRIALNFFGQSFKVDVNMDGQIQESEALQVLGLDVASSNITSLVGIQSFKNLQYLNCNYNLLTSLNLTSLPNLSDLTCIGNQMISLNLIGLTNLSTLQCEDNKLTSLNVTSSKDLYVLNCSRNQLTSLNFTGLTNLNRLMCSDNKLASLNEMSFNKLTEFQCNNNQLKSLNIADLTNLEILHCYGNQLTSLDFKSLTKLRELVCHSNQLTSVNLTGLTKLTHTLFDGNKLETIFAKNGIFEQLIFSLNPTLKYICVDEEELRYVKQKVADYGYTNCVVNSYCSLTPGGTYYTIQGNQKYDYNQNGCDSSDEIYPNLNFSITNGTIKGNIISDTSGNYSIPVQAGTHSITPVLENPTYFNVSPPSISVNFPTQTSPFIQNFCLVPNGIKKDLEVTILPMDAARPGFDATYKIIYKNKGNQTQSGAVVLSFNDAVLDLVKAIPVASNQATDKLTWDYTNLKPLESREITVTFNVNSPMETPAVNNGDRLSYNALITPVAGDEKPVDNSFALRQTVVGSYDPNDKTCLEGDIITPDLIGEYVHYLIRFENTGTYPAQNVVIKDMINLSKFDISTLIPTKASHDFVTKISDGTKVEFIFENIQLPFSDATNDGYIAFKIKTLSTLKVGDSFQNEANIYFDYNFPILTNTAKSTFQTLGNQDFQFANYFSLYPNPVNDILNIETKNSIDVKSIAVYDILGQIIIAVPDAKTVSNIDVSKLSSGNYFLKMNTNKGTSNGKFIKN